MLHDGVAMTDKKSCICQPYVPLMSFRSPGSMDLPVFLSKQVRMTSEKKKDGLLTRECCLRRCWLSPYRHPKIIRGPQYLIPYTLF
jgi:hypothetical protein